MHIYDENDCDEHVWAEEDALTELARSIVNEALVGHEDIPEEKRKELRAYLLVELLCLNEGRARLRSMLRG